MPDYEDMGRRRTNAGADLEELRRYELINSITHSVTESIKASVNEQLRPLIAKVDQLWDERNTRTGAEKASSAWMASLVAFGTITGSLVGGIGAAVISHLWK